MDGSESIWNSPDNKIKKQILDAGVWGNKPSFNSECTIQVENVQYPSTAPSAQHQQLSSFYLNEEKSCTLILGFAETAVDRELEKCILQMNLEERSAVTVHLGDGSNVCFTIKLCAFVFRGLIFEWDAKLKCELAARYKEEGVRVFKLGRIADSSHLFSRGLKLLLSIPIAVGKAVSHVGDVPLTHIQQLRTNFYNNLASCNLKCGLHENAIALCDRVLEREAHNAKALYKRGVAAEALGRFDAAKADMMQIVERDRDNRAALLKIKSLNVAIDEKDQQYNVIVKKMFSST